MLYVRRIVGDSMLPGYYPGSLIVLRRFRRLYVGDVVMLRHNGSEKIKRIAGLRPGEVFVLGDNPGSSSDSRDYGWLPEASVSAKVLFPKHPKPE